MNPGDLPAPLASLAVQIRETPQAFAPEQAFAPAVIDAAARLADASPAFQTVLTLLQRAAVRLRDWRAAIKIRRVEISQASLAEARRRAEEMARGEGDEAGLVAVRMALLCDDDGKPRRNAANLTTIFAIDPRWAGRLAYHALREAVFTTEPPPWHAHDAPAQIEVGEWTEQDSTRASAWISREWNFDVPSGLVTEAIETVARKRTIDPLQDYLGRVRHDGVARIDTWLSVYLGAEDTPYTRAVGARWLISAVARAYDPGCKVDCVLVLEGFQGTGKSSALAALCPDEGLFFDDELEIGNKDAPQALRGKWIVELGELGALSRAALESFKAFITRKTDTYRPSFGRRAMDFRRRCVFAGSTNKDTYLRDEENRRFWPVATTRIDYLAIERDRDLLWAEARDRYFRREPWHVDTPELAALCRAEQDERAEADPWEVPVVEWLDAQRQKHSPLAGQGCLCATCKGVTTAALLGAALGLEKAKWGRNEEMRAAGILRRLGWRPGKQRRQEGQRIRPYFPPGSTACDAGCDGSSGTEKASV